MLRVWEEKYSLHIVCASQHLLGGVALLTTGWTNKSLDDLINEWFDKMS